MNTKYTKPSISYNAQKECIPLTIFYNILNPSHSQLNIDSGRTDTTQMENQNEQTQQTQQTQQTVGWDEVGRGSMFVLLEQDKRKTVVITNWKLQKTDKWGKDKFGNDKVEFGADVVEEDNKECNKKWTSTSWKLINKLKPILSVRDPTTEVRLSVKRIGDKTDTTYDLEALN